MPAIELYADTRLPRFLEMHILAICSTKSQTEIAAEAERDDVYGHYHPDRLKGVAAAMGKRGG